LKNQPRQQCVAIILDFDNFKYVNDNYGHQTGDAVLKSFGKILKHVAGDEHIAGRIGGDEFFLFLKNCGTEEATQVAQRVLTETRTLRAPDGSTPFSCSIGIAVKKRFGGGGQEPEKYAELFARADQALYIVKECGKNNYNFADE
jgi:diguanylate cyclase (GGDEF)-like protein